MAKTVTAVEAEETAKKAPMTAAERKAAQRARDRYRTGKNTMDTARQQLNVTVTYGALLDLERLAKNLDLTQGELVSRLIRSASYQMGQLKQSVDGLDIPSDVPLEGMAAAWQEQPRYSNHAKPMKGKKS